MRIFLLIAEILLYLIGLGIIFSQSWQFGVASVVLYVADTMKTIRMNKAESNRLFNKTRVKTY